VRNIFRGEGYFNVDSEPEQGVQVGIADHRLRFRWDVFNVTNAAKFDVAQLTNTPDLTASAATTARSPPATRRPDAACSSRCATSSSSSRSGIRVAVGRRPMATPTPTFIQNSRVASQ
jgi:hypothetical protein